MTERLRLVAATPLMKRTIRPEEKQRDHMRLLDEYLRSRMLRNHAESVMVRSRQTLQNFFASTAKYAWEVSVDDVKEYHETLYDLGLAPTTRRGYLGEVRVFYQFLEEHPVVPLDRLETQAGYTPVRIEDKYGVRVHQVVDRWFLPRHINDDRPLRGVPSKDRLRAFFAFLRGQIGRAHKDAPVARDYAMFRLFYHTGLRLHEVCMLDVDDVRFDYGTIHCRFGKGSKGSGPRERYVPLRWCGLDKVLSIYLKEVRPRFLMADKSSALFLSESGGAIGVSTVGLRLTEHVETAQGTGVDVPFFTPHDLRRAFATHLYEEHPDKIAAIQQILGHVYLSTTQRYLRPSLLFIQRQFEEITGNRMVNLLGGEDLD